MRMERMKIPPFEPKVVQAKPVEPLPELPTILNEQKQEVLDRIQEQRRAKADAKKAEQKAKEEEEEKKQEGEGAAEEEKKKEEEAEKPPMALANLFDLLAMGDNAALEQENAASASDEASKESKA